MLPTRPIATAAALVALATACKAPLPPATSPTPDPGLAAPAEIVTPSEGPTAASTSVTASPSSEPTASPDPSTVATNSPTVDASEPGERSSSPTATTSTPTEPADNAPRAFRLVGSVDDAAGDEGLEGPSYADVRRVTIEDDGERARVRVVVGGALPTPPDEGEVLGIGVDLLVDEDGDSTYQLFADGGEEGWLAYLQTPEGFVEYPGEFRVGATVVEFVIPWDAVGAPSGGPFRAFVDWSQRRALVNAVSEDQAPDRGAAAFERS